MTKNRTKIELWIVLMHSIVIGANVGIWLHSLNAGIVFGFLVYNLYIIFTDVI